MTPLKRTIVAFSLAATSLSGCAGGGRPTAENVLQGTRQVAINTRDNAVKVTKNIKSYFIIPPYQEPHKKPVNERYCYQVLQDIMCYSTPQPGAETRLVAYQGAGEAQPPALTGELGEGSIAADTTVRSVQVIDGGGPRVTSSATASDRPLIVGDARDRAFDRGSPNDVRPIFIPAPPAVAAQVTPPPVPATPEDQ